jgi:hypothetical protein
LKKDEEDEQQPEDADLEEEDDEGANPFEEYPDERSPAHPDDGDDGDAWRPIVTKVEILVARIRSAHELSPSDCGSALSLPPLALLSAPLLTEKQLLTFDTLILM